MRRFRWCLSLFAASVLLAAGLVGTGPGVAGAGGQPAGPAGTGPEVAGADGQSAGPLAPGPGAAAGAGARFVPGTGGASARVARLALRSSGAAVAFGIGSAKARYQGSQGNASAAGADLGLLGLALTTPFACGRSPGAYFPDGVPPQPVSVSSGDGPVTQRSAAAGSGTPVEFLSQEGSAAPNSEAAAKVTGVAFDLAGVVAVAGGSVASAAKLTPGTGRDADARSEIGSVSLAGGTVRLDHLVWAAAHRSGAEQASTGAFSVGGISLAGTALPTGTPADLARSLEQVNAALAPSGLALHAPAVVTAAEEAQVTPLRLSINTNPALRAALGPALAAAQPVRSALLEAVAPFRYGENCGLQTGVGFGFLLFDLFLVFFGDQGGIDIDFGGARAGTDGIAYANPFESGFGAITRGTAPRVPPPPAAVPPAGPATARSAVAPAPRPQERARPAAPPAAAPGAAPGREGAPPAPSLAPARSAGFPAAPLGPVEHLAGSFCRSSHPRRHGGCAEEGGAGLVAGWLALAVIAGLAAADRARQWRARRRPTGAAR